MNKRRLIYLTDAILIPLFVLSLYSGIQLHIAGHGTEHDIWHNWAVFHTIDSLLFAFFGIIHIKSHWFWYKGLKNKKRERKTRRKQKIVLLLTFIFIWVIITGIWLLCFVEGANSPFGKLHYKAGLLMGILGLLHIVKRLRLLKNGLCLNTSHPTSTPPISPK